ncbi:MAG TPA: CNNM domain-containing protein, partial [Polyangiaceae bacterium]|nr:CNNM domain-containing protein [Polyangiaceae bacterium]
MLLTEMLVILVLIVGNGVFAGAEIAVVALRKARIEQLAEEGNTGAGAVLSLRADPERFLATVQVGITVIASTASVVGGASLARQIAPWFARFPSLAPHAEGIALGAVVVVISYLTVVLGELVPKSLALRGAERYALLVARPLQSLSWIARPAVWFLSASANLLLRPFGDSTTFTETRHSAEELQELVEEATVAGTIPPEAAEIASRALDLPELTAADVMVPRGSVVM